MWRHFWRIFFRVCPFWRVRSKKVKLILILILICLYLTSVMKTHKIGTKRLMKQNMDSRLPRKIVSVKLPYVVVHIDLKGAPPKMEYLLSLLNLLKKFGVNALLMEYEDMFPYEDKLKNLKAPNCYSKKQLKKFLSKAIDSGFEIIPLVQVFGHMEFVLKLKEFQHLCEAPALCDVICTYHNETMTLIEGILKQFINFHKSIVPLKHIHIGFNEIDSNNRCDNCNIRKLNSTYIFFSHLKAVTQLIKKLKNDIKILIWDDIMRGINRDEWNNIIPDKDIEPVYWDYRNQFTVNNDSLHIYHKKFDNIWIASAFKGADGHTASLPNIKDRVENNFNWMNLILDYKFDGEEKFFQFKGIILTGWSRYSHFAPLCELLPASIPSLILNLLLIQRFAEGIPLKESNWHKFYHNYLKDKSDEVFECSLYWKTLDFSECQFESKKIYKTISDAEQKRKQFTTKYLYECPWVLAPENYTKYNRVNKRLTMLQLENYINFHTELLKMETKLKEIMLFYYDDTIVKEYVGYTYYGIKKKVNKAFGTFCHLLSMFREKLTRGVKTEETDQYLLKLKILKTIVCSPDFTVSDFLQGTE